MKIEESKAKLIWKCECVCVCAHFGRLMGTMSPHRVQRPVLVCNLLHNERKRDVLSVSMITAHVFVRVSDHRETWLLLLHTFVPFSFSPLILRESVTVTVTEQHVPVALISLVHISLCYTNKVQFFIFFFTFTIFIFAGLKSSTFYCI